MFREIHFLSAPEMKRVKPSDAVVVVSILDASEEHARRKHFRGFRGVLKLGFEDTYEEAKLAQAGWWPDEPTDEEHARFAQQRGERICTLTDATKIVNFLVRHAEMPDSFTLIAHCFGGVSRSAAVAHWASARFFVPIATQRSVEYANKRLLRLMDKAFQTAQLTPGSAHQMSI